MYLTLLTGGGLVAVGSVANGLLTNWLGSKRDKDRYEREQVMAREARVQERLHQATSRSVSTCRAMRTGQGRQLVDVLCRDGNYYPERPTTPE